MRVLASVIPGTGHLLPLLPSLHALRDAGDTVLVASAEPLRAEVEGAGLDFAAVGPSWHESDADALLPGFRMAGSAGQLGMFAELAPAVVPDLLALADDVRPHLLLREPYEFAAWLAAERSGLPMGTVFNTAVDLLRTIVAGVAALDVEVLVTTGQTVDPAMLGPQPAHVHRGPLRPTTGRAGGGRRRRVPRRGGDGLRRPLGRGTAGGHALGRRPADLRHGLRACRCRRVPGARPATAGVPGLRD